MSGFGTLMMAYEMSREYQERKAVQGGKTGWPPGLLQDDEKKLSRWLSNRPGARRAVDQRCAEIRTMKEQT